MADQLINPKPEWLERANAQWERGEPFSDLPIILSPVKRTTLPTVALVDGMFTVEGVTYHMEADLSTDRFMIYQKWEAEAAFGTSFKQMMSNWRKVWDWSQESRFGDIVVLAWNTMNAVVRADANDVPYLKLCALFLNTAGEDRTVFDQIVIDRKIQHWREAGVPIQFFFQLSGILISGFIEHYDAISQGIFLLRQKTTQPPNESSL
jgi:hypothetical protein